MSKLMFRNKNFQKWLFLLGGTAFLLSLLKNIFLTQHPGTGFYMIEFLAYLFFLMALFVSDKNNQQLRALIKKNEQSFETDRTKYLSKIDELKEAISGYEEKENEATRFASYQDQVIKKLTSDKMVHTDKHHFLYLVSELFHGMAVVFYGRDKQSDRFIVVSSYGLPEDFEPESFDEGEGLHGQAAEEKMPALIDEVPNEYVKVFSGLGASENYYLYLLPVIEDGVCTGILELLTFRKSDVERIWPEVMAKLVEKKIV